MLKQAKKCHIDNNRPFVVMVIGLFAMFCAPYLLGEGMFFDGLDYAAIARNMANGTGSFWKPQLTETLYPEFYMHPPLAMGILSLFYYLFGCSLLVEKLYSMLTFVVTGILVVKCWKTLGRNYSTSWLPILFWLCCSTVIWAIPNNLLENTMQIFIVASVWCYLVSINRQSHNALFVLLSGFFLFLAFMTKGVTSLYPLVMPMLLWILRTKSFWQAIKDTCFILAGVLLPFLLMLVVFPESLYYFEQYFQNQIVASLDSWVTVSSRFYILKSCAIDLIPIIAITLIVFALQWKSRFNVIGESYVNGKKMFWFLFVLALCGVLPIMISMKQSSFYILTTFPLFALAFAYLLDDSIQMWVSRIGVIANRVLLSLSVLLVLGAVVVTFCYKDKYARDVSFLNEFHQIIPYVGDGKTISIDKSLAEDWRLHAYFIRYKNVSLDKDNEHTFLLLKEKEQLVGFQSQYQLLYSGQYSLYKQIGANQQSEQ